MAVNISNFKGVNNVIAPYKLSQDVGTEFLNVDIEGGTLRSAKDYTSTAESMQGNTHWNKSTKYDFKSDKALSKARHINYIYFTSKGIDPTSNLQRLDPEDNSITDVGLPTPGGNITLSDEGEYYYDADFTYAYYYYAVTYYDSVTGDESAPLLSDVFGAIRKTRVVNITGIDTTKDKIRIYRVGNYITKFSLVVELDANTTDITYNDSKPDTAVNELLQTSDSYTLETGATNLVKHQGRFYVSVGSRLRFSVTGQPGVWKNLDFIDMEDDIVGLASLGGALVIFLRYQVHILAGSDINTFVLMVLISDAGCVDTNTIGVFRSFVVFMTDYGLCITDGSVIKYVTRFTYKFDTALEYISCATTSDRYFLLAKNKFLFEMDFRHEAPILLMYDNVIGVSSINTFEGELYGCTSSIVKFFSSEILLKLAYTSKDIVGENYDKKIEIEKISYTNKGDFLFYINVNNDIITKENNDNDINIFDNFVEVSRNETLRVSTRVVGKGEIFSINFHIVNTQG